jgi:hypothetical protein
VRERSGGSGCDVKYRADSQFILVRNDDGTTTRYEHLEPAVKVGQRIQRGDRIAVTSQNGYQCEPMLSVRAATSSDAAIQLEFEDAPPAEGLPRMAPTS